MMSSVNKDISISKHSELLGYSVILMLRCQEYSKYTVGTLKFWTEQAILHEQIRFYFDAYGDPVGYLTWAFLAEDVEYRILNDDNYLLHPSEWNEGDNLWILDFVFPSGLPVNLRSDLKLTVFKDKKRIKWIKRGVNNSKKLSEYKIIKR